MKWGPDSEGRKGAEVAVIFNLTQAEEILPRLEQWLKAAMEGKQKVVEIEGEFARLIESVMLTGGRLVDVPQVLCRRREKEEWLARLRKAAEEIESSGCLLKDLDTGLVDFPCELEGREVYLCWKLGEPAVQFWHHVEEGFAGRKPIDQDFVERLKRQRSEDAG